MSEEGRVMGIDHGEARIGVALSDPFALFAAPHAVLESRTADQDFAALKAIADEHGVVKIVVGLPTDAQSRVGAQAAAVIRWARGLAHTTSLPVVFWDESYSTISAEQLAGTRRRAGRRNSPLDDVAAATMLQEYLDARQTEHEPGQPLEAYADIP